MPRVSRFLIVVSSVLLLAAKERAVRPTIPPVPPPDVFSFSEPTKVLVQHVSFDLTIDFTARELSGTETLDIRNFSGTHQLVLDTSGIDVHSVTTDGHNPATFRIGTATSNGAPLSIDIQQTTQSVTIDYTATQTSGLRWTMTAPLTPFVYSDAEPTGTRTWLPIQDTPAVRMAYDATLRVPAGNMALMTAENNPTQTNDSGIYFFHQVRSVPAYLIAFAAGHIAFHAFDARTGVYAQPEVIDDAALKLGYVPDVLNAAESLIGTYPWTRYDILLMPAIYSGGMENPNLNFMWQEVLGNAPPSRLVTHELSHSWAGDMVTLAAWPDTWLNEGLASYYELRLLEPFHGPDVVGALWNGWKKQLTPYGPLHRPLVAANNPNSMFDLTSYVKGALFFHMIESEVGRDAFDAFMRDYFRHFAFRWVDDVSFVAFLKSHFDVSQMQLDQWLYEGGLPANAAGALQSFQVAAPQTSANSSAADDVSMVAVTGPRASEAMPAKRLETLIVNVTNP